MKSYLDARLIAGVRVALDQEILTGSGVAPHLLGLLNRPGLAPPVAQGTMTAVDAIATQIAALATANEDLYPPDAIVVHPNDWAFMTLIKASDESYIGGSPFDAPTPRTMWGLTVVTTSHMTPGQALVGALRTASQLFLRGGIIVTASNSHQDFFVKNLQAIRAEQRAAVLRKFKLRAVPVGNHGADRRGVDARRLVGLASFGVPPASPDAWARPEPQAPTQNVVVHCCSD